MNKKIIKNIFYILVVLILINFKINVFAAGEDCSIISEDLQMILDFIYGAIRIVVPILVLVLCSLDLLGAVGSGKEDDMKKATSKAIKRVIIGVAIFFIPTILNLIFSLVPITGTCGIGG